jgi:hypothetical protein
MKSKAAFPKTEVLGKPRMAGLLIIILCLGACESLSFNYYRGRAWSVPEGNLPESGVTARLVSVTVDRSGGWASVEKEIWGLAPLLFFEEGCRLVPLTEEADYAADIRVREREYAAGWQTRRSLAVEVRLWPAGELLDNRDGAYQGLPCMAGRVTSLGDRSFSSSETTGRMLALAIKKALRPLGNKRIPAAETKNGGQ